MVCGGSSTPCWAAACKTLKEGPVRFGRSGASPGEPGSNIGPAVGYGIGHQLTALNSYSDARWDKLVSRGSERTLRFAAVREHLGPRGPWQRPVAEVVRRSADFAPVGMP